MTKILYLVRHGQANERAADEKDFDRLLTSSGIQQATKLGFNFHKEGIMPDMIITSPADRARTTATLMAEQLKYNTDLVHLNDEFYEASVRTLFQAVTKLKDAWDEVIMVGHNPSISYLAEYVTGEEIGSLSAGGYVSIGFQVRQWSMVTDKSGEVIQLQSPDQLDSPENNS